MNELMAVVERMNRAVAAHSEPEGMSVTAQYGCSPPEKNDTMVDLKAGLVMLQGFLNATGRSPIEKQMNVELSFGVPIEDSSNTYLMDTVNDEHYFFNRPMMCSLRFKGTERCKTSRCDVIASSSGAISSTDLLAGCTLYNMALILQDTGIKNSCCLTLNKAVRIYQNASRVLQNAEKGASEAGDYSISVLQLCCWNNIAHIFSNLGKPDTQLNDVLEIVAAWLHRVETAQEKDHQSRPLGDEGREQHPEIDELIHESFLAVLRLEGHVYHAAMA